MATLASYFLTAMSNIEPEQDATNAKEAHARVSDALKASAALGKLGIDPVLIGSYKREVSIRRVKDVDVFGRMTKADSELRPSRALTLFEDALLVAFDENLVERQHRSFKVDFPEFDLSVDAVPARPCGDHWEIPKKSDQDNQASWIETNPLKLNDLTTATNTKFVLNGKGIYVPTVKLIRQIRRVWIGDQPGGLFFELLALQEFTNGGPSADSRAGFLVAVMDLIEKALPVAAEDGLDDPTMPGKKILTKATDADFTYAVTRFAEAANLAREALVESDDCRAAVKWQRLLGTTSEGDQVFPTPEYCNADGTRAATGTTLAGATASPAGTGRYA